LRVPEIPTTSIPEILATSSQGAPRRQCSWKLSARHEVIDMLKRHAIQVLRTAGHTLDEIAEQVAVGKRSVQRVIGEPVITHHDTDVARAARALGRPSKAEAYRATVAAWLTEEPPLLSVELLRRAQLVGYAGGKSALYDLVRTVRVIAPRPVVRFEGLPGAFTQHDFGEVLVRFLDGTTKRIHFFASRLKYSRNSSTTSRTAFARGGWPTRSPPTRIPICSSSMKCATSPNAQTRPTCSSMSSTNGIVERAR
jgi:transposase